MVRLVFRPYTQIWRTICTSVSLWASIRVSPEFTLHKHSSPSFGSYQMCSGSNISQSISRLQVPAHPAITFIAHTGFRHLCACTCARLLGPCFKTGQMKTPCFLMSTCVFFEQTHSQIPKFITMLQIFRYICTIVWKRLGEQHCKLPAQFANSAFPTHT